MGIASSRDENGILFKHAVERLDTNVESWLPGYEDRQKDRGYLATAAFVELSIGNHSTFESFLTAVLASHGLDREKVEEVRLDYKLTHDSTTTFRITKDTFLGDIIKSEKTVLVFKVLKYKPTLRTRQVDFGNDGSLLKPEPMSTKKRSSPIPYQQAHPPSNCATSYDSGSSDSIEPTMTDTRNQLLEDE